MVITKLGNVLSIYFKNREHFEKESEVLVENTSLVQNMSVFNTPELPLTGLNAPESCSHFTAGISVLKNASMMLLLDDSYKINTSV